ncbi:hypothetical protein ACN47E_002265 [Coniothyrium glycines]
MTTYPRPTSDEVNLAAQLLSSQVIKTPLMTSPHLNAIATARITNLFSFPKGAPRIELFLKCENLQKTGSFKFRGASHFLAKRSDQELVNGVVAYSTGNHAQAVAHAAQLASQSRRIHVPTYVVVPSNCPEKKVKAAEAYGARVSFSGTAPQDRVELAKQIEKDTCAVLVPPADHADIVLGQATAVKELLEQAASLNTKLDAVIVPSGGGGLLVGAIAVCKPNGVAVFAAEPKVGGPGLARAIRTGVRCEEIKGQPSVADGLRSLTGTANWEHIRQVGNVQGICSLSDEQIKQTLGLAVKELQCVLEPSAVVALGGVLHCEVFAEWARGRGGDVKVGVVLSGGNIGQEDLQRILPEVSACDVLADSVEAAQP